LFDEIVCHRSNIDISRNVYTSCWISGGKFAGFVWVFPFPVIAFGNISHMSPLLSILSILAFIVFIIFVIMFIISLVRYRRGEQEEELTY
jgi:membrane protein YdbS with pleckstrin-like domain